MKPAHKQIRLNGRTVNLHKHLWETAYGKVPDGKVIDHINGDPRDNRLENMRLLTKAENAVNSDKSKGKYMRGVSSDGNKYRSFITVFGVYKHLGSFATELQAHWAYKFAREKYYPGVYRCGSR